MLAKFYQNYKIAVKCQVPGNCELQKQRHRKPRRCTSNKLRINSKAFHFEVDIPYMELMKKKNNVYM